MLLILLQGLAFVLDFFQVKDLSKQTLKRHWFVDAPPQLPWLNAAKGGDDGAEEKKDGDGGPHPEQVCRRLLLLVDTQAIYRNKLTLNSLSGSSDI